MKKKKLTPRSFWSEKKYPVWEIFSKKCHNSFSKHHLSLFHRFRRIKNVEILNSIKRFRTEFVPFSAKAAFFAFRTEQNKCPCSIFNLVCVTFFQKQLTKFFFTIVGRIVTFIVTLVVEKKYSDEGMSHKIFSWAAITCLASISATT